MSITLQYNYAIIDATTFQCRACLTMSYEVPLPTYIEVPDADDNYCDKYYNLNGDKLWYWDAEFTQLWVECPSHNQ